MLEKMNGHETHGSVEKGTLEAARKIKAINPKVKILFYLNSMLHYGGYDANNPRGKMNHTNGGRKSCHTIIPIWSFRSGGSSVG